MIGWWYAVRTLAAEEGWRGIVIFVGAGVLIVVLSFVMMLMSMGVLG